MTQLLFTTAELTELAGSELVEQAKTATDIESISRFHYDVRGRLEAGIKPAVNVNSPPSFAKITKRGSKVILECRHCGRNVWCIHTVILVLHHLGSQPVYRTAPVAPKPLPSVGFKFLINFSETGAQCWVMSRSTGHSLHQPLQRIKQQQHALGLSDVAAELLLNCGIESDVSPSFTIDRSELHSVLQALQGTELHNQKGAYAWEKVESDAKLKLRIDGNQIHWQKNDDPAWNKDFIWVKGRPGFLIHDQTIYRNTSYTPDFQALVDLDEVNGCLPLDATWLNRVLRDRHAVVWASERPLLIPELGSLNLELTPSEAGINAQLGVAWNDKHWPLDHDQPGAQLLTPDGSSWALIKINQAQSAHIHREKGQVRAAWDGTRFHVRKQQARDFLSRAQFPADWETNRQASDRWFGLESAHLEITWEAGAPHVSIDGESFEPKALIQGILDPDLIALPDGRLARVDTRQILRQQAIGDAVSCIHQDGERRENLIKRLKGDIDSQPADALEPWQHELLRPYQRIGVSWLCQRHHWQEPALLADDMGLGKTIQTLIYLDIVRDTKPQLIVVPKSLLENWCDEIARFTPHRLHHIHHGSQRRREAAAFQAQEIVITTYGTLRADIDLFADIHFSVVVLDEAQMIKNPDSQVSQAARELWADQRVALSGTPIENRLDELWSLFDFFAPGYLGEREPLRRINHTQSFKYKLVRDLTAPFILRRLKKDVAPELPEKQEMLIKLPLSGEQALRYQKAKLSARSLLDQDGRKRKPLEVLTQLLRLRQICCHSGLVDDTAINESSSKFDYVLQHLADIVERGHATLIFSQFTQLLKLLAFDLEEQGYDYLYLDGATRNRADVVKRFQQGEAPIFLISLKAGGVGLNLTRASYVFIMDPWWNPMVERQAVDRAHRIGQTQTVFNYRLVTQGTVEERIVELQRHKSELADQLWEASGSAISQLSDQEIDRLFE